MVWARQVPEGPLENIILQYAVGRALSNSLRLATNYRDNNNELHPPLIGPDLTWNSPEIDVGWASYITLYEHTKELQKRSRMDLIMGILREIQRIKKFRWKR